MHIICKLHPDLYSTDMLSWNNHMENKDQKIAGMSINVSTISTPVNMPVCMSHRRHIDSNMEKTPTCKSSTYIILSWLHKKQDVEHSMKQYCQ